MPVSVDLEKCDGSAECLKACAFNAIEIQNDKAVIFENCTDCGACVTACPTQAIFGADGEAARATGGILVVDFGPSSGIVAVVERVARTNGMSCVTATVGPLAVERAVDAIVAAAAGHRLIVLPHSSAGCAIAAQAATMLGASLLTGCADLRLDQDGAVRGVRPKFAGAVKSAARCAPGLTIATLYPRNLSRFDAAPLDGGRPAVEPAGEAPAASLVAARRIVSVDASLSEAAASAARECAKILGATVIDPGQASGKFFAPDLYVAFGVSGSTEHNAAFRNSRVVVSVVDGENAPIAQIADYVLTGDVTEHAKALLAALM